MPTCQSVWQAWHAEGKSRTRATELTVKCSGDAKETSDTLRLIGVIMDRSSSQRGLHVLSTVFIKFYTIMQIRKITKAKKNSGHRTPPQEHPMILEVGSLSNSHINHIPSSTRPGEALCDGLVDGRLFWVEYHRDRSLAGSKSLKYVQSDGGVRRLWRNRYEVVKCCSLCEEGAQPHERRQGGV